MANSGLGIDIVEIERFRNICERTPSFTKKMFSESERKYCDSKPDPYPHYAARFAAKEAVLKALGTGFSQGIGYRDVEVELSKDGRPTAKLYNKAAEIKGNKEIAISISHTSNDAVCCAMVLSEKPAAATTVDELTRQFKELRLTL